jgi:hypothetical protein
MNKGTLLASTPCCQLKSSNAVLLAAPPDPEEPAVLLRPQAQLSMSIYLACLSSTDSPSMPSIFRK